MELATFGVENNQNNLFILSKKMSQEVNYEEFECLDEEESAFAEIDEEMLFTKEMQNLQSALNRRRLSELQRKITQLQKKQFNIYIGDLSLLEQDQEEEKGDMLHKEIWVVYAKGLTTDWDFPLFTFYIMHRYSDENFKMERLLKLTLELLYAVRLQPFACILDWSPSHQRLLDDLGITVYNPYIEMDRRRTMLCLDFFKILKKPLLDNSIPPEVLEFMKYFDKECDNLENWQTEFTKFKALLQNAYNIGVQVFVLYYAVASRIATLELAKIVGTWPLKMVHFRHTMFDLFLYRIKLEHCNNYEDLLKALPDIYREYY